MQVLFDKIKNVKFRAYYYIYEGNLIPKMHLNAIRKLANVAGGIRLYRNGFRVLPYGEPGDDWLSLDMSTRRRSILPTHTNISFFGFVEIENEKQVYINMNNYYYKNRTDDYYEDFNFLEIRAKEGSSAVGEFLDGRRERKFMKTLTESLKNMKIETPDDFTKIMEEFNKRKD